MNRLIQPDIHPDADSLNALVEKALPETERARILAHMAECARCREVVFLAQAAAGAEAAPTKVVTAHSEPRPARIRTWLSGSPVKRGLAWIPAAALAAIGGVVIWVEMRPAPAPVSVAQNAPQQPVHEEAPSPNLASPVASQSKPPAIATPLATHASTKSSVRRTARPVPASASQDTGTQRPPMPTTSSGRQAASADPGYGESAAVTSPQVPAQQAVRPAATPPAHAAAMGRVHWQQVASAPPPAAASRGVAAKTNSAPQNAVAFHGTVMTAGAVTRTPLAVQAPQAAPVGFTAQPLNGLMALKLTRHARVPSGLETISSAAVLDRLLTIDSAGTLFLSHDAGKHWEAIPSQWSGKAVEVHALARIPADSSHADTAEARLSETTPMVPPATTNAAPENAEASSQSSRDQVAPVAPAMLFMLVNDRHETWVSADGKVWRAK